MSILDDLLTINNKSKNKSSQKLSTQEAHQLWNIYNTYNIIIDNLNIFINNVHDKDLKYQLNRYRQHFQQENKTIAKKMKQYKIKSPKPAAPEIKTQKQLEIMQDTDMAQTLYLFLKSNISVHIKTIKDSLFSDDLREFFMAKLKRAVNLLDDYIEYLKAKNWIESPPLYSGVTNEEISANEVYHIWEHLNFRNININQNKIYLSFIQDNDFKILLKEGIDVLTKQANDLKQRLIEFGAPLPIEYPESIPVSEDKEVIGDEYIYNMILNGMQMAGFLHGSSIQEMIVNEEIRHHFKKLLFTEMNLIDDLIKYGKLKGWLSNVPKLNKT
ncbi:MAG: DUF3231 family protein [bacterium]